MSDEIRISVRDMTCASCVGRVERALRKTPGVESATVNLATEQATVTVDPAKATVAALLAAVTRAGYRPVVASLELGVRDMTCASCVARVEKALRKLPGVLEAGVNLATERAAVRYLPGSTDPGRIRAAISEAGYQPVDLEPAVDREQQAREGEQRTLRRALILGAALSIPLLVVAMAPMIWSGFADGMARLLPARGWHWVELFLAAPVQFVAGRRFYRQGWAKIRHSPE